MPRDLAREFRDAYPGVPVEPRTEEKSPDAFERLRARLARGETGSVGALVKDRRGFVLLQRHDPATGWPADAWAVPGGGVKAGEDFEAAVVREVLEETGLHVEVLRPLVFLRQTFTSGDARAEYPFVLYACRPLDPGAAPRPREREVAEVRWFHRLPAGTFDRDVLLRFA